jgi:hypothetical protein
MATWAQYFPEMDRFAPGGDLRDPAPAAPSILRTISPRAREYCLSREALRARMAEHFDSL